MVFMRLYRPLSSFQKFTIVNTIDKKLRLPDSNPVYVVSETTVASAVPESLPRLKHFNNVLVPFLGAPEYLSGLSLGSIRQYTEPCPGPWIWASVMTNSFLDPSTTFMHSSWFYLVYLIWYHYLSVKFVMWIVKQKIENIRNLFKKLVIIQ